ncbi:hypothetical protein PV11_08503 [Exophiala sideris]|uniref:NAD-dependent epimerase/dehydratase domain-containing protein n=1 Tax=Exophiala sideris TaxID=1016849 RepID=A0A0D1VXK2_9EURO|nr:hypothetical protein PV11_08503 [Exophiala sideris]
MAPTERRLKQGDWVLVTGANGYIGSHVADVLLEEGYNVRGTVRAEKPWLNKLFDGKYGKGRFETVPVPVLDAPGAYDEAIKGVAGVLHVATHINWSGDANDVIPHVVEGSVNILKAAAKEPSVKSVVHTSSSTAAGVPVPNKKEVIDENSWNDAAVQAAWAQSAPEHERPYVVYAASKTEGERESWKWYKENKPHFVFNSVLPNYNTGPILASEIPGSTGAWALNLLKGDDMAVKMFPAQWYVDVKDDARLHVAALLDPKVESERLFAYAGPFNWTDVVGILHKLRPDNEKIPKAPENEGRDVTDIKPSKRAEQVIKDFFGVPGWTSLEDSLAAGIASGRYD